MKNVFFSFFLFFLFSCKGSQKSGIENCEIITVDIDNELPQSVSAFNQFSFVNLEVTDASMIADIGKVVCHKDRIYVLSIAEPTVFIFNHLGGFERKLTIGQGPGEVVFVSDVTIHNDSLYVLDRYRNIKIYDLNGDYIKDKEALDSPYFSLKLESGGLYLFEPNINAKSNYNLYYMSDNGDKQKYLPKENNFRDVNILFYNTFSPNGYIVWPLSNVIHKIDSDRKIVPVYEVDFKGKWISGQDYKSAITNEDMGGGKLDEYARWIKDFMPIENGCFFGFKYQKNDYFVRYQNGKSLLYSSLLEGMPPMHNAAVGFTKNSLIYAYSVSDLKDYKDKHKIPEKNIFKDLYDLAEDENVNPILVFTMFPSF